MTVYRKAIAFDGSEVRWDKHGEPPPGDPDGPWQRWANQLAAGHRRQSFTGWEYKSTLRGVVPEGWDLNDLVGDGGREMTSDGRGGVEERTYWRRRKP